jgi:hypothetical protein
MLGLGDWVKGHKLRAALAVLGIAAVLFLIHVVTLQPRTDRHWKEYLAKTTHVVRTGDGFAVEPESDWSYAVSGPTDKSYGHFEAAFADLKNVWLMVEPSPASDFVAHTLLLFEFGSRRLVGLTIEARLEEDETYSAFDGMWDAYELSYVWASARDLLTRRAVMLGHRVFVYPLKLSGVQMQALLVNLLKTGAELESHPRFYNTLFHNCTNELAKRAGLSWNYAFVLTGKSPGLLFRKRLIPGDSFEAAKAHADITAWLADTNGAEKSGFDARLLTELRARETR